MSGGLAYGRHRLSEADLRRFLDKIETRGPDECWPWKDGFDRKGYGKFGAGAATIIASRLTLQIALGRQLSAEEQALHTCDNPPCCNPAHLYCGTHADNMRDMATRGRAKGGLFHAAKAACPKGHAYDEKNTRIYGGRRHCRSCDRARLALRRRASADVTFPFRQKEEGNEQVQPIS
jgi:hypothetical protein